MKKGSEFFRSRVKPVVPGPHPESATAPPAVAACSIAPPVPATAVACGKAIIVGEHAVVYGAEAVAMPLMSMRVTLRLSLRPNQSAKNPSGIHLSLGGRPVSAQMLDLVEDALHQLRIPPFPLDIQGSSSILIGAGLGSSAALCVGLVKTLTKAVGRTLGTAELARLGNELERRFHGSPSGLDTAVVAAEKVVRFRRDMPPRTVTVNSVKGGFPFALLDSGLRSSTRTMIDIARPYFAGQGGRRRTEAFDEIAAAVAEGLESGDHHGVGEGMREAGSRLLEAGLANDEVNRTIEIAKSCGALGAKITGAGGGGCVLALLDPRKAESQIDHLKLRLGEGRVHEVRLP